jgi:hypothetical protein
VWCVTAVTQHSLPPHSSLRIMILDQADLC